MKARLAGRTSCADMTRVQALGTFLPSPAMALGDLPGRQFLNEFAQTVSHSPLLHRLRRHIARTLIHRHTEAATSLRTGCAFFSAAGLVAPNVDRYQLK